MSSKNVSKYWPDAGLTTHKQNRRPHGMRCVCITNEFCATPKHQPLVSTNVAKFFPPLTDRQTDGHKSRSRLYIDRGERLGRVGSGKTTLVVKNSVLPRWRSAANTNLKSFGLAELIVKFFVNESRPLPLVRVREVDKLGRLYQLKMYILYFFLRSDKNSQGTKQPILVNTV